VADALSNFESKLELKFEAHRHSTRRAGRMGNNGKTSQGLEEMTRLLAMIARWAHAISVGRACLFLLALSLRGYDQSRQYSPRGPLISCFVSCELVTWASNRKEVLSTESLCSTSILQPSKGKDRT